MRALVIGGASCAWDDLRAYEAAGGWAHTVIAVNDVLGSYRGWVHHFASLHMEKFPEWREQRRAIGGNLDFTTWARPEKGGADRLLSGWSSMSSGGFAVGVALDGLGCEEVDLCGVPMTNEAHFFDDEPWQGVEAHWPKWLARADRMRGRVFSMSGETRKLLGAPPWLKRQEVA